MCITKDHNGHELIEEEDFNKGKVELKPKQKNVKIEIVKSYTTDLKHIHLIAVCSDGSMWIGDNERSTLQHVELKKNITEVITSLSTKIYGIATTHSNNILIKTKGETKLELMNAMTGKITDSIYDINPLKPTCIYVTSDHRVIIGAWSGGKAFPVSGRRVVVVMDQEGKHLQEYEHDKHYNKRIFTYPRCISVTSNGNIFVVDHLDTDHRGRVVVLSPEGDILLIYNGHPGVNTKKDPFRPVGILTTQSDTTVITDMENHSLRILSDQGQIITYFNLRDMGILGPYSLALSTSGTIYIGCVSADRSPDTKKAKLYELKYSGF
ncbi:uncharacterized protein LOC134693538 [Mytilus trossulus]|uniref:uncharacterized protein LOC134693538 n=1 Tax=Mytilus trossulus TaxID=6551 RepID=UPI0030061EE6